MQFFIRFMIAATIIFQSLLIIYLAYVNMVNGNYSPMISSLFGLAGVVGLVGGAVGLNYATRWVTRWNA
jgi:hypothetical protein